MISALDCCAQPVTPTSIWKERPRYQLGLGLEGGYVEVPQERCSDCTRTIEGLRIGVQVRARGNLLLGAGYSSHDGNVGHESQFDTTVVIPAHQELVFQNWNLVLVWVPEHEERRYHVIRIDQQVTGYDLTVGWALPAKWPRRRCHVAASAVTGLRLIRIQETHQYMINTAADPEPVTRSVTGTSVLWSTRIRADLHVTKFASVYAGLNFGVRLAAPNLSSEVDLGDEHVRVKPQRDVHGVWPEGGIAIHL